MQKFIQKQKGAISIFLVIILLPMLTIGCTMVDMSRISLARATAESAGDLALNTGLTCYDNVLKDMYGLFAVSQDYDSLMSNLSDYYRNSLQATGLSERETDDYLGQIMDYLEGVSRSGDFTDLLQIHPAEEDSITVSHPQGATLINPALLKSQIVQFMKYRGPINMGLGFLDSLKSFTTLGDQMDVVDKRNEYYDEQKTVIESCETAWKAMYAYQNLGLKEEKFKTEKKSFDGYLRKYIFISDNLIKDYYEGNKYFIKQAPTYATGGGMDYTFYYKSTRPVQIGSASVGSWSALEGYANKMQTAMAAYEQGIKTDAVKRLHIDLKEGVYEIQRVIQYNKTIGAGGNYGDLMHDVYVAYETYRAALRDIDDTIDDLEEAISDRNERISDLEDSLSEEAPEGEETSPEQSASRKEGIRASIDSLEDANERDREKITEREKWKADAAGWTGSFDTFYKRSDVMPRFADISQKMKATVNGTSKLSYDGSMDTFSNADLAEGVFSNAKLGEISGEAQAFYDLLEDGKKQLGIAETELSSVLEKVKTGGALESAEGAWKESAGKDSIQGMAVSEQNLAEVDSVHEFINENDVSDLLKHIFCAKATLKAAQEQMDKYKYGKEPIREVTDFKAAIESLKTAQKDFTAGWENQSILSKDLTEAADTLFEEAYQKPENGITAEWADPIDNPDLEKIDHRFYAFLKNTFHAVTDDNDSYETNKKAKNKELKDKEKKLDDFAKTGEDEVQGDSGSTSYQITGDTRPSVQWPGIKAEVIKENQTAMSEYQAETETGSDPKLDLTVDSKGKGLGQSLITMFSGLGSAIADLGVGLRDNLFLCDYIMNMFSYDTIEKEALWEANGSEPSLSVVKSSLHSSSFTLEGRSVSTVAYGSDGKSLKEGLEHSQDVQKALLTLTNVPVCPEHNAAYLSEVEYMVYGKNSSSTAYGTIYGIRFAFNTVYAFSDSSIRDGARGIAMAIFGTPPLTFLVPIAQAAIIIGVALAESALDLQCLKAGMAVPLYKNKNTWMLSFQNLFENAKDLLLDTAAEKAKSWTDRTVDTAASELDKWLSMTGEELKNKSGAEIKKLSDAVQDSLTTSVNQYAGTAIDQLNTICQKARMLKNAGQLEDKNGNPISEEAYVEQALTDWLEGGGDIKESVVYLAKKEAINVIVTEGFIAQALDWVENMSEGTISAYNDFISDMSEEIESKFTESENAVNKYIDKAVNSVSTAVSQGADELKDTINTSIDGMVSKYGSGTKVDANVNVVASLYSYQYSDYLRLFLMISLMANQEKTLLRMGDVIQSNMNLKREGFLLKNSGTYLQLDAVLEVKPLFMKLPFMPEDTEELLEDTRWYTIRYHGIQGY
ncbi:DUF5702 domain-containing protein [Anaerocolumna xylanovorans]|uniref:Flp pilus-assembly TadE/G-like n=1 Tax=Anaerocolumna xylanovorans DSM 12503 TaxID=1121345 RepID=A0A1M7YJN2_9FIRM|nr:DUF5702 domain-containing protein [Anaerocolumna xylanovorans]SHO52810.1 hypothetical protein SAMN02745217_03809 [Anaerocolumna xylanovorans DSM 12503]